MGRISRRRRRSLPTLSVRVMVFSDTAGAGFKGIVHVWAETRQAEEHDPVEARRCPSCPYTIHVNPSEHASNGKG